MLDTVLRQVIEEDEYMRRKLHYQSIGQRHFYFMNIGNGEVIDACRKVRSRPACAACPHGLDAPACAQRALLPYEQAS